MADFICWKTQYEYVHRTSQSLWQKSESLWKPCKLRIWRSSLSNFKDVLRLAWDFLPGNWNDTPRSSTSPNFAMSSSSFNLTQVFGISNRRHCFQIVEDSFLIQHVIGRVIGRVNSEQTSYIHKHYAIALALAFAWVICICICICISSYIHKHYVTALAFACVICCIVLLYLLYCITVCHCPCLCLGYLLQRPPVAFLSQAATALPTLLEHILKKYIFYLSYFFSFFFCTPNPPSLGVPEHNAFLILYCSWGVMDMDNGALGSF